MFLKALLGVGGNWKVLRKVQDAYKSHPQLCSAATGFITFSLGDVIAQKLEKKSHRQQIDFKRSLQLGLLGVAMNGFFLHRWFIVLDKVVGSLKLSTRNSALMKVVADQFVYAPFAILTFFGYACAFKPEYSEKNMDHKSDISINRSFFTLFQRKIENSFVTTYIADCTLWPMANYINFRFVPLVYRASFTAITQLIWQTYLSVVTHMSLTVDSSADNSKSNDNDHVNNSSSTENYDNEYSNIAENSDFGNETKESSDSSVSSDPRSNSDQPVISVTNSLLRMISR